MQFTIAVNPDAWNGCRFGYQLFTRAAYPFYQASEQGATTSLGGPARFAKTAYAKSDSGCQGYLKVWPVVHDSGELRIMVVNKGATDCTTVIRMNNKFGDATLQLMTSDTGNSSTINSPISKVRKPQENLLPAFV